MNVFVKLKRLQEVLRRNGRMKILYQELLNSGTGAEETLDDQAMTTEELEKSLKTAKEAVAKAVIGGKSHHISDPSQPLTAQDQALPKNKTTSASGGALMAVPQETSSKKTEDQVWVSSSRSAP